MKFSLVNLWSTILRHTPGLILTLLLVGAITGYFVRVRIATEGGVVDRQPGSSSPSGQRVEPPENNLPRDREDPEAEESTVLAALSRLVGAHGGAPQTLASLSTELLDPSYPLLRRQKAAWSLAQLGSEEAIAMLLQGLQTGPPLLRVTIAEALGSSQNKKSQSVLRELLRDNDPAVARAAIRGIGAVEDAGSVKLLAQFARDAKSPEEMRIEAALSLGKVSSPAASEALTRLLGETTNEDLVEAIVSGLGEQSFAETEGAFRTLLGNPTTPIELRVAALEALGQTEGDPTILLMEQFDDPEPAIRAAAAWALTNLDNLGNLPVRLLSLHAQETDAEVRARITQALKHHGAIDP
jgi:HEAT repeat protein